MFINNSFFSLDVAIWNITLGIVILGFIAQLLYNLYSNITEYLLEYPNENLYSLDPVSCALIANQVEILNNLRFTLTHVDTTTASLILNTACFSNSNLKTLDIAYSTFSFSSTLLQYALIDLYWVLGSVVTSYLAAGNHSENDVALVTAELSMRMAPICSEITRNLIALTESWSDLTGESVARIQLLSDYINLNQISLVDSDSNLKLIDVGLSFIDTETTQRYNEEHPAWVETIRPDVYNEVTVFFDDFVMASMVNAQLPEIEPNNVEPNFNGLEFNGLESVSLDF